MIFGEIIFSFSYFPVSQTYNAMCSFFKQHPNFSTNSRLTLICLIFIFSPIKIELKIMCTPVRLICQKKVCGFFIVNFCIAIYARWSQRHLRYMGKAQRGIAFYLLRKSMSDFVSLFTRVGPRGIYFTWEKRNTT